METVTKFDIVDKVKQEQEEQEEEGYESTQIPPVDEIDERNRFDRWSMDYRPMSSTIRYGDDIKIRYKRRKR